MRLEPKGTVTERVSRRIPRGRTRHTVRSPWAVARASGVLAAARLGEAEKQGRAYPPVPRADEMAASIDGIGAENTGTVHEGSGTKLYRPAVDDELPDGSRIEHPPSDPRGEIGCGVSTDRCGYECLFGPLTRSFTLGPAILLPLARTFHARDTLSHVPKHEEPQRGLVVWVQRYEEVHPHATY